MKKFLKWLKPDGEISRDRLSAVIVDAVLILAAIILFVSYGIRFHSDPVDTTRGVAQQAAKDYSESVLPANTYAAGVDISNLTVREAKEKISAYVDSVLDAQFELVAVDGNEVPATLRQLSLSWVDPEVVDELAASLDGSDPVEDYKLNKAAEQEGIVLEITVTADKSAIIAFLEENCSQYDTEMTASEIVTENGRQKLVLGTPGRKLNLSEAASSLQNAGFKMLARGETRIELPIEELYPPSIPEGYEDMEGIEQLLAEAEAEQAAQN